MKNNIFNYQFISKIIILIYTFLLTKILINKSLFYNNNIKSYVNNTLITNIKQIRFIIVNAPDHNNYGDEAILMSTKEFLKNFFPTIEQIIIFSNENYYNINLIKYIIKPNDIIIISGGGYFGFYEYVIQGQINIIKTFPLNNIFLFPCSIYLNKTKLKRYKQYIDAYNNHKHLTLFTRDLLSYKTAVNLFNFKSIYNVPDIVTRLNLKFKNKVINRKGVLLNLRKDNEILLTENNHKFIKNLILKFFNNSIYEKDSNKFKVSKGSNKEKETIKFIKFVRKKELVLTDRLHGMILSIITNTPCIVFGNNYHKVESSYYSWFKDIQYVIFIDNKNIEKELENSIIKLKNLKNYTLFNKYKYKNYYLLMKKKIQEKIDSMI